MLSCSCIVYILTLFPGTIGEGALGVVMPAVRPEGGARPSLVALVAGMRDMGKVIGSTSPLLQREINFIA